MKKKVAIKILRPDIEKLFNEELDALLFAYIVENTFLKAKRLKLVEVVHLLREITNIEMDLRFELQQQTNYMKIQKMIRFNVPKFIGIILLKKF